MIKSIYRVALSTALIATVGFASQASAQVRERDLNPRKFSFAFDWRSTIRCRSRSRISKFARRDQQGKRLFCRP
jgi:hypothetical protein